jgi:hypothetical protein
MRFGAREITRSRFMKELQRAMKRPTRKGAWRFSDAEGIVLDTPSD